MGGKAKEVDREYGVIGKAKEAGGKVLMKGKEVNDKNDYTGKVGKSLVEGMSYLQGKVSGPKEGEK